MSYVSKFVAALVGLLLIAFVVGRELFLFRIARSIGRKHRGRNIPLVVGTRSGHHRVYCRWPDVSLFSKDQVAQSRIDFHWATTYCSRGKPIH